MCWHTLKETKQMSKKLEYKISKIRKIDELINLSRLTQHSKAMNYFIETKTILQVDLLLNYKFVYKLEKNKDYDEEYRITFPLLDMDACCISARLVDEILAERKVSKELMDELLAEELMENCSNE
ncbi:MAG: hypothetical protein ISR65_09645 [Bacteriovoracaceae bacterium]|nr:hypothetical protein [Bacteriovoracaceae bacterium]